MESVNDITHADSPGRPSFGYFGEDHFDLIEDEDCTGEPFVPGKYDNIRDDYVDGGKCIDNPRKVESASNATEPKSISKLKPNKQNIIKTVDSPGRLSFGDWGEDPFDFQEEEYCFAAPPPPVPAEFNNIPADYADLGVNVYLNNKKKKNN